jgi:hypothetical protein
MKLTGENKVSNSGRFLYNNLLVKEPSDNKMMKILIKEAYRSIKSENGENTGNKIKDAHLDTILIKPPLETYKTQLFDDSGNLIENLK